MNLSLDSQRIANIIGSSAQNVSANWPLIAAALDSLGLSSAPCAIAAIATIRVESPTFMPRLEKYDGHDRAEYFTKMYFDHEHTRKELGNLSADDAVNFCGRGFIQITGRSNYAEYGRLLGCDLLTHPELALEPRVASAILAAFFFKHNIKQHAEAGEWKRVRAIVNGGDNGLTAFLAYASSLEGAHNAQKCGAFAGL